MIFLLSAISATCPIKFKLPELCQVLDYMANILTVSRLESGPGKGDFPPWPLKTILR